MKTKALFAMLIAFTQLPALPAPAAAQENETPNGRLTGVRDAGEDATAKKVLTIRLKGATLGTLLSIVSEKTGLNFTVHDPELAEKKVTVFMRNASAAEIMELLTKSKNIEFQRLGQSDNYVVLKSTAPFGGFPPLTRKDIEDPLLQRVVGKIRLRNAPLTTFLDIVSAEAKVNFLVGSGAEDITITTYLTKITVVDVLQFLKTKGLVYSRIGDTNTFVVRPLGTATNKFAEAEKAFENKDYEWTIATYKEFLDASPDSEMADNALLKMAISYDWIAARDNDPSALKEEEKLLNRLITAYPKSARLGDAYLYLGQIYSGYGGVRTAAIDCPKAIRFYDLAIKNSYRDWVKAQAGARIAQCHERAGDKEKAAAMYREVVEKYPDTAVAKELRESGKEAYMLMESGTPIDESLLMALTARRRDETLLETGTMLERQAEYGLAMEVYKKLGKKGVAAGPARKAELRTGICQAAMGETAAAIKTFKAYIAKHKPGPEDESYTRLIRALEKAGRPDEAQKYRAMIK